MHGSPSAAPRLLLAFLGFSALVACGASAGRFPPLRPRAAASICNGRVCEDACDVGNAAACMHRAAELQDRLDTSLDRRIADLLAKACPNGHGPGCLELAVHCGRSPSHTGCVEAELGALDEIDRNQCLVDASLSCIERGRARLLQTGAIDAKAACPDVVESCFLAGYALVAGYGGERDPRLAASELERGCDAGNADACDSLEALYRKPLAELPKDDALADAAGARAIEIRARDCDIGDALSCMTRAKDLATGRAGLDADPERAAASKRRACELGLDDPHCAR